MIKINNLKYNKLEIYLLNLLFNYFISIFFKEITNNNVFSILIFLNLYFYIVSNNKFFI